MIIGLVLSLIFSISLATDIGTCYIALKAFPELVDFERNPEVRKNFVKYGPKGIFITPVSYLHTAIFTVPFLILATLSSNIIIEFFSCLIVLVQIINRFSASSHNIMAYLTRRNLDWVIPTSILSKAEIKEIFCDVDKNKKEV